MKITVTSSKAVKPDYGSRGGGGAAPSSSATDELVPLTVFDKVNYDLHVSGITFFRPPSPPTAALEAGLARALAEYREWAGRLVGGGEGEGPRRAILLNDAGARFVEATAPDDVALQSVMPMQPTPAVLSLHPGSGNGDGEELLLVQVTRFACGSVAVGHTMHHAVADGRAACNFLLAWGQATRAVAAGAAVSFHPVPAHDRASLFLPRAPPLVTFDHRGVEFKPRGGVGGETKPPARTRRRRRRHLDTGDDDDDEVIVVERVRFSREFLSALRSSASSAAPPRRHPHSASTVQCVAAHLWRCITRARRLAGDEVTKLRLAVDGRTRIGVPDGYAGNVVLWAWPTTTAAELLSRPLGHAAGLISRAVARVDEGYFRSFIDFASSGAVEEEALVPTADGEETVCSPDVDVDSLLRAPFCDLDFGGGPPFFFMPGYVPAEGAVFLVRPCSGDPAVDAYVPLLSSDMEIFRKCCYSLEMPPDARL